MAIFDSYKHRDLLIGLVLLSVNLLCSASLFAAIAYAEPVANTQPQPPDLSERSLEDLLNMEVTSVSKHAQKLSDSAAAIYVITQEDIRRSGLNSIPELLRLAPGLQVAKIDAANWSVGSRGFGGLFSSKLLVLIDGRSVYNPLFSGVWWSNQDTIIDDIDRIEIIRGPGATLWGANAVNGVINIVTKNASETQSALTYAGVSNSDQTQKEGIRYGGQLNNGANYRFYAKTFNYGNSLNLQDQSSYDSWDQRQGGFRLDWNKSETSSICLQGDVFDNHLSGSAYSGNNILLRYKKDHSSSEQSNLQMYYDHTKMNSPSFANENRSTLDLEYQRSKNYSDDDRIIWGLGLRQTSGKLTNGAIVNFSAPSRTDHLINAFVQKEIAIKPKVLQLTVGSKIEHNNFTGIEIQPNIRALWTPSENRTIWASVSRAVRTPSVAEYTAQYRAPKISIPGQMDIVPRIDYNPALKSEVLVAHELGYRINSGKGLSLDAAAFYNVYSDLQSFEPSAPQFSPGPPPFMTVINKIDNKLSATSRGLELVADWRVTDNWKLTANCSWISVSLDRSASKNPTTTSFESLTPKNQFGLSSYWTLPGDLEVDALLFRVGACNSVSTTGQLSHIPAYTRLDLRLGKPIGKNYNMSLGVRNALDGSHAESGAIYGPTTKVERSVYCTLSRSY